MEIWLKIAGWILTIQTFGYCLGYHPDEVPSATKHHASQSIAKSDLYHTCYIYIYILQNQLVGNVKAQLLREVLVKEGKLIYVH